jgi:hypothetical protein
MRGTTPEWMRGMMQVAMVAEEMPRKTGPHKTRMLEAGTTLGAMTPVGETTLE